MRLWFAMILALSVMLAPLGVAGAANAMSAPGCAAKAGSMCPCKNAPKACANVCAAVSVAAAVVDEQPADSKAHSVRTAHALPAPLSHDGIARGLDPPVPRA